MAVALLYGSRGSSEDDGEVTASQKAMVTINTLCSETDYKEACVNTLKNSGANTSDPKELVQIAFQATMKQISDAAANSTLLKELENDPRGKAALEACKELADDAVNDLNRTLTKFSHEFSEFDLVDANNILADLKIWLSGAITNQETCLDGFEGVNGDAGEKMKESLNISMEMSSNVLAMMTGMQSILATFTSAPLPNQRRLLEESPAVVMGHEDEIIPNWVDLQRRKLLSSSHKKPKLHKHIKPDLIVAQDGSGDFTTINEALFEVPKREDKMFVLYIKEGVYQEPVKINSSLTHLLIIGDGPTKTKITGNLNFIDGTPTYHTATVAVHADNFMAMDIGFENSAGPDKHQAVAIRVSADLAVFYNCQVDGYQDTLYTHTYRQFYRDCTISGTIDFIFGDAAAIFQSCTMIVRKPMENQYCIVTAQGRKDVHQPTGIVLQNCSIVSDPAFVPVRDINKAYLGRPWKQFSRTVIMESYIDETIQPDGWMPWNTTFALDTLFYTEFNNRGPRSDKSHRVTWPGIKELPAKRIKRFTADRFIDGEHWLKHNKAKVPYKGGFFFEVPEDNPDVKYSPIGSEETKDEGGMRERDDFVAPKTADSPSGSPSFGGHIAASPWMQPSKGQDNESEGKKEKHHKEKNKSKKEKSSESKKDEDEDEENDHKSGKSSESKKKDKEEGNDHKSEKSSESRKQKKNKDGGDDHKSGKASGSKNKKNKGGSGHKIQNEEESSENSMSVMPTATYSSYISAPTPAPAPAPAQISPSPATQPSTSWFPLPKLLFRE